MAIPINGPGAYPYLPPRHYRAEDGRNLDPLEIVGKFLEIVQGVLAIAVLAMMLVAFLHMVGEVIMFIILSSML